MSSSKMYEPWQEKGHAKGFDGWYELSSKGVKKNYESFNEIRLLLRYKHLLHGKTFLEVGCATGELYRYVLNYHKDFEYHGLDISAPAIERAKYKYPDGKFYLAYENKLASEIVNAIGIKPSILFSRDVVVHQTNPFEFLEDVMQIPAEMVILRLRTRDKGTTVLDPEQSCQHYFNKWVPFMVLNVDEMIESIRAKANCEFIHIVKNYMQLGGHNERYLVKDCYYANTGTAETSVCIKLGGEKQSVPKIIVEGNKDSITKFNMLDFKAGYTIERVVGRFKRLYGRLFK